MKTNVIVRIANLNFRAMRFGFVGEDETKSVLIRMDRFKLSEKNRFGNCQRVSEQQCLPAIDAKNLAGQLVFDFTNGERTLAKGNLQAIIGNGFDHIVVCLRSG
ncbi:hypothetical protein HUU39_19395 [candidate division KSB1 bacterium]|nr:hypothetical protein [bacterium]NUM67407.1 hypothetical protein [candidate division KSB1 bacterium]